MGQHAEAALPLAGRIGPAAQGASQPPLVPRDRALRLPPLPVHAAVARPARLLPEPPDHLPAVPRLRPLPAPAAAVDRDHGGASPEVLPGVPAVLLGVERR